MTEAEELHKSVRRVNFKSSLFTLIAVVGVTLVLLSTTWLDVRVVQLTTGLGHATHKIATQQKTLSAQQKSLDAQQKTIVSNAAKDAAASCAAVNVAYATSRSLVREEAVVSVTQAISLYQRTQATLKVNPPKNDAARKARVISDAFLRNLVLDTVHLSLGAIQKVDGETKPLDCNAKKT